MSREFKYTVKIRYSDKNANGVIHPSTYLGFFESARFSVMDEFILYCKEKNLDMNYLLDDIFYVVATLKQDMEEKYNQDDEIEIITSMSISRIPLITFTQRAQSKSGIIFSKATIKNAMVSKNGFNTLTKWEPLVYDNMYEFINL